MHGRCVTVVGAGKVAARKAEKLARAGAKLSVIAPQFFPSREYWQELGASTIEKFYTGLEDAPAPFLVLAATDQAAVNALVARDARALGALVARADETDDSDIAFPATLRRGRLSVSYATDGASPFLARLLRENAQVQFDGSYAVVTELLARLQQLPPFKTLNPSAQREFLSWERISATLGIVKRQGEHAAFAALVAQLESVDLTEHSSANSHLGAADGGNCLVANSAPNTPRAALADTRGLFIVHTGDGKGKTSAAMNLVYRHLAHGKAACVVQFIKNPNDFEYGDVIMLERLRAEGARVSVSMLGAGYTWRTGDAEECKQLAARGWQLAAAAILDPSVHLVVCDELHIALRHAHLELAPVLHTIAARPLSSHVVTTGRDAPAELLSLADLVTEFVAVRHPYEAGVRAQAGIEY
jgi:cob(I)alamin adenosyltransferase